jgi:DnaJ-class molecular chaperone
MPYRRLIMKKILLISFIILLIAGCTKLGEPAMHPNEWADINSENSHVAKIVLTGTETCKSCHGTNGKGGTSEVACDQCHAGGLSGHEAYNIWVGSPDSPDFHGKDDLDRCQACHGEDYLGGLSEVSCSQCHAGGPSGHPATSIWVGSPDSDDFHGEDDIARCVTCHGDDYFGGTSGVSCYQCHDGPNAFSCPDYSPPSTHNVLQDEDDCEAYHMPGFEYPTDNGCTICHGVDLTGGFAPSCFTCHGNRWDDG